MSTEKYDEYIETVKRSLEGIDPRNVAAVGAAAVGIFGPEAAADDYPSVESDEWYSEAMYIGAGLLNREVIGNRASVIAYANMRDLEGVQYPAGVAQAMSPAQ